ncbi:Hypermethylated in cancer 2 protein [Orchesella cincta]|uniref:Hypermethylated in cancer 2 protein n=1 Tax=Orchesella cincta TaxID=48709 RepID=A0A1D2MJ10_ORCCI|nr:Hypermethylated in cancer 2 protein [Orchesella cincta]
MEEEEESAEVHQNEQERDDDEAADDFEPDIDDNPPSEDDNDDDATKYKKRWAIYHFLTKHLGISKTLPDNSQTKKQCPICKRPFNVQMSKREIDQHIKMEHDVEGMDPTKVSRCSICDVPFVSQRFLTQHMKLVHKFEHKNLLASHVKWHERLEQTFPCKECSKVYTKADTLRRHVQSVHSPDEMMPFCCDTCGKLFGRKDRLVQHVRTHSEQKATFDCNLCGASFKQESKLKSHFESTHGNKVEVEIAVVDPSQIFIVEADN